MEEVNVTCFEQIRGKKIKLEESLSALATDVVEKKLEWENEDQIEKIEIMTKKTKQLKMWSETKLQWQGLVGKSSRSILKKILHVEIVLKRKAIQPESVASWDTYTQKYQ